MTYEEFLKTKKMRAEACGFEIDRDSVTPYAFDYQKNPKQIWVPSKKGLGMRAVFDMVNEVMGKEFYRYE